MLEFNTLVTVPGGFELDGELITDTDARYTQIVAHIAGNDAASRINTTHRQYLADTDWYVTRLYETGEPMPAAVTEARAAARAAIV